MNILRKKILVIILIVFFISGSGLFEPVRAEVDVNVNIKDGDSIVKIMEDIEISESEVVSGDVVAIIGDISIQGKVEGDVISILGDIDVDNYVGGDITAVMGNINLRNNAEIRGKTTEVSVGNLNDVDLGFSPFLMNFFGWNFKIFKLIMLFGLAVLVFSLMPKHQHRMIKALEKEPGRKLIIGLISVLVFPIIMLLLALTIIGIPFIPIFILTVAVIKFIGYVSVVFLVGNRISGIGNQNLNIYLKILFGVVALWLLNSVPFLGVFSYFIVMFLSIGVVLDTKFGTNRPWFKDKKEIKEK